MRHAVDVTYIWILSIALAYLLGTLPSAHIVSSRKGLDPTKSGSGNPGATNVLRTIGKRAGVLVLLADAGKGAAAASIGLLIDGHFLGSACWVSAVVGHIFPATRRLRGGKGVATGAGGCLILFPLVAIYCTTAFLLLAKCTKRVSIASILTAIAMPLAVALVGSPRNEVIVAVSVSAMILIRHQGNLKRLLTGSERSWRN